MNLYVRLRTFLAIFGNPDGFIHETRVHTSKFSEIRGFREIRQFSEIWEYTSECLCIPMPNGTTYDKNVRNRTYRFISCQEKKSGWKILFFRGEILISKLWVWRWFCRFWLLVGDGFIILCKSVKTLALSGICNRRDSSEILPNLMKITRFCRI